MKDILEYIMANYTWFLGGAIIILLAIIGSYADKTNFGQGKEKIKDDKSIDDNKKNDDNAEHEEPLLKQIEIPNSSNQNQDVVPIEESFDDGNIFEVEENENKDTVVKDNSKKSLQDESENNFKKFDKEFNEIVPEKEVIDDDLLDEIENLSLDKTRKIEISQIPDLDDVELPEIKNLKKEDEDIWKF